MEKNYFCNLFLMAVFSYNQKLADKIYNMMPDKGLSFLVYVFSILCLVFMSFLLYSLSFFLKSDFLSFESFLLADFCPGRGFNIYKRCCTLISLFIWYQWGPPWQSTCASMIQNAAVVQNSEASVIVIIVAIVLCRRNPKPRENLLKEYFSMEYVFFFFQLWHLGLAF